MAASFATTGSITGRIIDMPIVVNARLLFTLDYPSIASIVDQGEGTYP
jgi:hypothetical protein